ncbi:vWA domain-containing protein [Halococcus thailandensis]|uniref:von Willebrand factor A n=1 Tax=Halococcus thailandensis JCM 13552 TaxID=1227457 RepID=M0NEG1_9EURY|nr:VWA domain-containing protein [Halococcus thailandensis]EMA56241.1 von Willebrand factor A [Halococcus thailandensis JCM 13552]
MGAFSVRQPGDDKQYDLVMILDRSGSMRRHMHIDTAEDALVRFAIACEDIGINVGVVDFTQDEARLVKPFSVECEHVRESLLSKQYGGGTPLADALGLGRELLEQRRNSPLVLVVTDGKPGDADAYHDELAQSYAPVCGLTLVLDQPSGSVPEKVARNERFYDRHVYIHESSQLANRLDQFAVMFDGL